MIELAAILACAILAGLGVFQVLLIFGLPLGKFAWGGNHEVLPPKLRVGSVISICLYILFALIILEKSELVSVINRDPLTSLSVWIITVYFFLGIAMNAISRSKPERMLMTPVALLLALLFLYVAM